MSSLLQRMKASPVLARAVPFLVFGALTMLQGEFGEASRYWIYLLKTVVGAWMLWSVRDVVSEMRWAWSGEAVVVGVFVFVLWVGLDDLYPKLGSPGEGWNPFWQFGAGSALGWMLVAVRILGSSIVVPPLEEVFYRSFVYRWVAEQDFQKMALGHFAWRPFLITSAIFGLAHHEWLAGILCGAAYQALVCRKKRLGDAMTAHAVTNLLLGLWVVGTGEWRFW
jgi:CAAX prenyl protease-like protein